MDTNEHLDELKRIEEKISDGEDTALIARWESGKYLNTLKNGKKQLPKGVRAQCIEQLGIGGSEVNARMTFADKYPARANSPMPSESSALGSASCVKASPTSHAPRPPVNP